MALYLSYLSKQELFWINLNQKRYEKLFKNNHRNSFCRRILSGRFPVKRYIKRNLSIYYGYGHHLRIDLLFNLPSLGKKKTEVRPGSKNKIAPQ